VTDIVIKQMPSFKKTYKKLQANEKAKVNDAIHVIIRNPNLGEEKKGDLAGIFVYKFVIHTQEMLLAYEWCPRERVLWALGVYENFYRDLKKKR
jgi:hypothetical protein